MIGNAILREVASIAAASVMIAIEAKASMKAVVGLNSFATSSSGGSAGASFDIDEGREVVDSLSLLRKASGGCVTDITRTIWESRDEKRIALPETLLERDKKVGGDEENILL